MTENLDGMAKNWSRVTEGWDKMIMEWKDANEKVADAWQKRDIKDMLHHISDYRGAGTQHLWRLHFYLFWPKWIVVGVLIWVI
jgi:hypothetical protein